MKRRLAGLEGLRGLLALWVAMAHAVCWVGWADLFVAAPIGRAWVHFANAQTAVGVFIILSGFAIWNLLASTQQSWRPFMVGRFFRLYPVYLLALTLGFLSSFMQRLLLSSLPWAEDGYFSVLRTISQCEATYPVWNLTIHLTLLHGVVPNSWISAAAGSFLPPAWSLSIEWQFYLIAPFLWAARRSWITWAALGVAFFLCRPFGAVFASPMNAFLPMFLPHFCIGIACAEVWLRVREILPRTRWILTSAALLLVAVAVLTCWNITTLALWVFAFGCVARWWDRFPPARWCRTFLDSRIPQWLGSISYPLYLLHWPLLIVTIRVLMAFREDWHPGGMLACLAVTYLPASVTLAWAVHLWIEKPGMNLGRSLIGAFPRIPTSVPPIRQ